MRAAAVLKSGVFPTALAAGVLLLSSCSLLKGWFGSSGGEDPAAQEGEKEEAPMQLIGEVASVHPGEGTEGFVLIRRFGGGGLPEGFVFHSAGASGRSASLRPTGERLGRFYAADITSGSPQMGDFVLGRRLPEAAEAPSTPVLAPPQPGLQMP